MLRFVPFYAAEEWILVFEFIVLGCGVSLVSWDHWYHSIFCTGGFINRYLKLTSSWSILFFLSMVIESFAGYSILGCRLWVLRVYSTSAQALLAFRLSVEKLGVNLIGLPLYVTWPFSLWLLIFFLCLVHLGFSLLCDRRYFCSGPVCLEFCRLHVYSWASLSLS